MDTDDVLSFVRLALLYPALVFVGLWFMLRGDRIVSSVRRFPEDAALRRHTKRERTPYRCYIVGQAGLRRARPVKVSRTREASPILSRQMRKEVFRA
jgi:hypothetical protein